MTSITTTSGRIHSDVYARWSIGEKEVVEGMKKFADLTVEAKEAITNENWNKLGTVENLDIYFHLRCEKQA